MENIKIISKLIVIIFILVMSSDAYALEIKKPVISYFGSSPVEKGALKIDFDSNNIGSEFTIELYNTKTNQITRVSNINKSYTYQNVKYNTLYNIQTRVCKKEGKIYFCSEWSDLKQAQLMDNSAPTMNISVNKPISNGYYYASKSKPFKVVITCRDNNSGNAYLLVNGTKKKVNQYTLNFIGMATKTYALSCTDNAGNTSPTKKIKYKTTDINYLILVNKNNRIPLGYKSDLINYKNVKISSHIKTNIDKMITDAKNDGITIKISSAYRNEAYQKKIFDGRLNKYINQGYSYNEALKKTESYVMYPYYSEHHTGLAFDFKSLTNDDNQKMYNWLSKNAYKYGFILRYPKDKIDITKTSFEQWHYRYVGYEAAEYMYRNNLCLEEYYEYKNI